MDKSFFLLVMWICIICGHLTASISADADDEFESNFFKFITILLYVVGIGLGIYGVAL